ncbi:MAG: hypothetical protein CMJ48_11775 [Planctomycetaceae bacterium]|nr:hypothetical protein [Planctomycetaceae bacterium]
MLNRLLYEFYKSANNGRQIASLPDGRRLLLVHSEITGPATLRLMLARREAPQGMADFEDVGALVGPDPIVPDAGPWGFGGSMVVVADTLHVAWTGPHGIQYARATWAGDKFRWDRARPAVEGDYWLGDLFVVGNGLALTWHQIHDRQNESVGIGWFDGEWHCSDVQRGKPMFAPVADVDRQGRIHLAWSDAAEQLYYARLDKLGGKPEVELLGPGGQPTILVTDDRILIACVSGYAYGPIRYYVKNHQKWQRNAPLTVTSPWLTSDLVHSPGLTRDRHGVVWLFFADSTRRSTFWTRWLGDDWSPITNGPRIYYRPPHFDFNLLPIGRLCVEKRSVTEVVRFQSQPAHSEVSRHRLRDIGLLLTCEAPLGCVEFRREVVPDLAADSGRKVLFLDMLEVARTENVRLHVETAVKHPKNPLMQTGPAGSFDEDRVFNHGTVLLDGGKYRMWYGGIREPRPGEPRPPWWDWIRCGYAESDDGIHWKRVRVGLVEWNGSRENNIVPYMRHAPVVIKDEKDPEPKRRYKAFYFWNSGEHLDIARTGKYDKQYDPRDELFLMDLFTSPDGIRLERHEGEVRFPGEQVKPLSAIPNSVFRDDDEPDPNRRYKAYGFMSLNLRRRGTSYLFSPDAQHWTAHPEMPLIDPAVRGTPPAAGGPTGQVHDTVCFPYEGYYLALYQDQHEPSNMPIELAVSRDADTFHHVKPGSKVIPVGDPDDWDAQTVLPSTPVILDREIRLYYGGGTERKPPLDGRPKWVALPGLATLRRDGFTSIGLVSDKQSGSLVTIPFRLPQPRARLHVNVDCPGKSRLRAELLDAKTGEPLLGYSLAECKVITGDQFDATITWTVNATLPRTTNLVRLHLELQTQENSPKLYAFWFQPR